MGDRDNEESNVTNSSDHLHAEVQLTPQQLVTVAHTSNICTEMLNQMPLEGNLREPDLNAQDHYQNVRDAMLEIKCSAVLVMSCILLASRRAMMPKLKWKEHEGALLSCYSDQRTSMEVTAPHPTVTAMVITQMIRTEAATSLPIDSIW